MAGFDDGGVFFSDNFSSENTQDDSQVNLQAAKRRFRDFLRQFHEGNFNYRYRDQLKQHYNMGQYWLEVAMEDISSFDEVLADKLTKQPTEHLPLLEEAAKEVADEVTRPRPEGEEDVADIQVMLKSEAHPVPMREIKGRCENSVSAPSGGSGSWTARSDRLAAALSAMGAMAGQAPVVGDVVLRAGFRNINAGSTFRDSTMTKGEKLYASRHVFDVNERVSAASSLLSARCVRQANVSQEAYSIRMKLDDNRKITEAHCTCKGGTSGTCKHAAAVVVYVNKEDTTTKTSVENVWRKPSAKQLGMYNKGVLFSDMYAPKVPDDRLEKKPVPPGIIESDCPLGIMLRKEAQVKKNLARLDDLVPLIGHPEVMFSAAQVSS
ncbi:hypothetical protein HPB48_012827 [Haemaphysalis longicornis]|uniref:DNA helicase n=1 Tax=Haemaphysalis longicornis TaxID=44386 RepID=A0A9J6GPM5_HAELO|nr:hypothetical protein HPB48_012827 [Haemaphysalis longicornis]